MNETNRNHNYKQKSNETNPYLPTLGTTKWKNMDLNIKYKRQMHENNGNHKKKQKSTKQTHIFQN